MFGYKLIKKSEIDATTLSANEYASKITALIAERDELKRRVVALEDAHEKSTGIKVRVDNTITLAKFTKVEMCVLQGVLHKYMQHTDNVNDAEFALNLYRKMTPIIQGMKEDV